jgi:hypothetical protein
MQPQLKGICILTVSLVWNSFSSHDKRYEVKGVGENKKEFGS